MVLLLLWIVTGFVLLIKGADWLVEGAASLARKMQVSDLAIGLTIVAFGTSAPELLVNAVASINGLDDIVMGNVIGSNLLNLMLILGVTGVIYPVAVQSSTVWKEIPISLLAVLMLYILAHNFFLGGSPTITRTDGAGLFILFLMFLYYVYRSMKTDSAEPEVEVSLQSTPVIWGYIIVGLAALILGGKLVVDNAVSLARLVGMSEKLIGLTIIAVGTSLPELVTSVTAAVKKNSDIAMGNIVGSNIFNILFVLSISAMIKPIAYNPSFNSDLYFLAGITLFIFIAMFIGRRHTLEKWQAVVLIIALVIYNVLLFSDQDFF